MRLPKAVWGLVKETARHLLRRPVVGLVAIARDPDGKIVLIRRGDTGAWCLPGGTLEWGETLRSTLPRELMEEAGVDLLEAGELLGAYSGFERDPRFHAVTMVVAAKVSKPVRAPMNPLEILEVRAFAVGEVPKVLSHGMSDVLARALAGEKYWE
ncbi:MAG: NUDIX domain-containing protein [Archangium sp.]|nr:NUDIX domain-containing protein [Archangium sp.]MDP3575542.1 NUDIX domain-containing protein [Archangium sp.]